MLFLISYTYVKCAYIWTIYRIYNNFMHTQNVRKLLRTHYANAWQYLSNSKQR